MGLRILSASSSDECNNQTQTQRISYDRYTIKNILAFDKITMLIIKYHNCTNYEGTKVLVYDVDYENLLRQKEFDPHFSESRKLYSPIARFEPNEEGIFACINYCLKISNLEMHILDAANSNRPHRTYTFRVFGAVLYFDLYTRAGTNGNTIYKYYRVSSYHLMNDYIELPY